MHPHPSKRDPIEYTGIGTLTNQVVDECKIRGPCVYTDGSKIEGKVGAALTVWCDDVEVKYRTLKLAPHCSVYQAELLAILRATEIAEGLKAPEINILSDSQSSLQTISNYTSSHPVAFNIRQNINNLKGKNINVRLFWLRAHVGTPGNERADELAKRAALYKRSAPDYSDYPLSYARQVIRKESLNTWNERYTSKTLGKVIQLFLPDVFSAYDFNKNKKPDGLLTQILTGHGGLGQYLHRFKIKSNPWCVCEPGVIEDVEHVLTECPRFGAERLEMECKIGAKLERPNLGDFLRNKNSQNVFIDFSRKVMKVVCKGNGSTAKWT